MDNKFISSSGRVSLEREILIKLRREKGLSQELLAIQCAEQHLSVSIASIKRAETEKNILYRTAHDIALFFNMDLKNLIKSCNDNEERIPLDTPTEQPFIERRKT